MLSIDFTLALRVLAAAVMLMTLLWLAPPWAKHYVQKRTQRRLSAFRVNSGARSKVEQTPTNGAVSSDAAVNNVVSR